MSAHLKSECLLIDPIAEPDNILLGETLNPASWAPLFSVGSYSNNLSNAKFRLRQNYLPAWSGVRTIIPVLVVCGDNFHHSRVQLRSQVGNMDQSGLDCTLRISPQWNINLRITSDVFMNIKCHHQPWHLCSWSNWKDPSLIPYLED